MNGMGKKRDEIVGKGETGAGNTPPETSYMCDWRLTWGSICGNKIRIVQHGTETQLQDPGDFDHGCPIAKALKSLT